MPNIAAPTTSMIRYVPARLRFSKIRIGIIGAVAILASKNTKLTSSTIAAANTA